MAKRVGRSLAELGAGVVERLGAGGRKRAAPGASGLPPARGTPAGLPLRGGLVVAALLVMAALPLVNPPRYIQTVLTEVFIYAIFAMSLDLLLGYTGLPSLGHAAFFGLGAYTAGIVALRLTPSAAVVVPAGVVVAGLGALLIGALCIRTSGVYFLMLTLAFSQIVYAAAFKWTWLTGGSNGLAGVPRPQVPALDLADGRTLYYVALAALGLSLALLWVLVRSPLGHTLVGIRENEGRMRALGYDTWRFKLVAFAIAGVLAGFAGALYVAYSGFVSPAEVYWTSSGLALVMVIIGGAGTLVGPALGAALVLLLQNWVSSLPGIGERWPLIMGLVFAAFVLFGRGGMVGIAESAVRRARGANAPATDLEGASVPATPAEGRA